MSKKTWIIVLVLICCGYCLAENGSWLQWENDVVYVDVNSIVKVDIVVNDKIMFNEHQTSWQVVRYQINYDLVYSKVLSVELKTTGLRLDFEEDISAPILFLNFGGLSNPKPYIEEDVLMTISIEGKQKGVDIYRLNNWNYSWLTVRWLMVIVGKQYPVGDLNKDYRVDMSDLAIMMENWIVNVE